MCRKKQNVIFKLIPIHVHVIGRKTTFMKIN